MTDYTYYNRGKCISCKEIIWNTHPSSSINCSCGESTITPTTTNNVEIITDEEFIEVIKTEFPLLGEVNLIEL